ncbi:MAG: hypothetical protein ACLFV7_10500 [Phycisphaerae bacterium]
MIASLIGVLSALMAGFIFLAESEPIKMLACLVGGVLSLGQFYIASAVYRWVSEH